MQRKIIIIVILFISQILLFSQNFASQRDSVFVVTDSLLLKEMNQNKSNKILRYSATITSIPVGVLNSCAIALIPSSNILFLPVILSELIGYPIFINRSIDAIQKTNAKERLLLKYSDLNIIDKTSVKNTKTSRYSIYFGGNYTTFTTDDVSTKPNISLGIKYSYSFLKYFSVSTAIHFSKQKLTLNNKKYEVWDMMPEPRRSIVDINFNVLDLYCPVYFSTTIPIFKNHKVYFSVGTGVPISFGNSSYEIVKKDVEFEDADYGWKELQFFEWSNPMYSYNFGYSNRKWFVEYNITQDYQHEQLGRVIPKKQSHNIYIDDELIIKEFVIGFYLH